MFLSVTIACFATSYSIALLLEIARFWSRSAVRGAVMLVFAGLGLFTHSLYIIARVVKEPTHDVLPLSSWFDWYLLAAWLLAALYFYLTCYHWKTSVGIFVLPLVLALVGVAAFAASREPFPQAEAQNIWGKIHGFALLLGTVVVSLGFVAGLMYLAQARRLKQKRIPSQGLRLPSLEWLERTNARSLVVSTILLAAGVLSGVILNFSYRQTDSTTLVPWTDPTVWSSGILFVWLVAVSIFNVFYKPARSGRKVAYLTVASFIFLAMILAILLGVPTRHVAKDKPVGYRLPASGEIDVIQLDLTNRFYPDAKLT